MILQAGKALEKGGSIGMLHSSKYNRKYTEYTRK